MFGAARHTVTAPPTCSTCTDSAPRRTPPRPAGWPRRWSACAGRDGPRRTGGARIKLLPGGDHALSDFESHLPEVFAFLGLTL